ncbi:uncharacterized protein CEXT_335361 [Caerostris extrusa]|uniref:Uncharacterized protein n=1 Tax=Caerostris extrusa TaxID=172846 RepID=A0AAV4NNL5_CAEEX|nr:uncharacterized protein CEXT_335361 [Caerostris extrusa]
MEISCFAIRVVIRKNRLKVGFWLIWISARSHAWLRDRFQPTTCPEGEHKSFNHCLCEHREEEQLKHFTPDSYVIIENSKPDVTGEATAKTESVYWKKLPLSASNSENFSNPRLKIKRPIFLQYCVDEEIIACFKSREESAMFFFS